MLFNLHLFFYKRDIIPTLFYHDVLDVLSIASLKRTSK